jgi:hypothetical protein
VCEKKERQIIYYKVISLNVEKSSYFSRHWAANKTRVSVSKDPLQNMPPVLFLRATLQVTQRNKRETFGFLLTREKKRVKKPSRILRFQVELLRVR